MYENLIAILASEATTTLWLTNAILRIIIFDYVLGSVIQFMKGVKDGLKQN